MQRSYHRSVSWDRLRRYVLAGLALLTLLSLGFAQEGWSGDIDLFALEDGRLTLTSLAQGREQAEIHRSYELRSGVPVAWTMECHYDRRPSRYNTFALDLFSIQTEAGLETCTLAPDPKGLEVRLVRTLSPANGARKEEVLLRHTLTSPDEVWSKVALRVVYDGDRTMRLSMLSPEGGVRHADIAVQLGGRLEGLLSLRVKFTSGRMSSTFWTEPTIHFPYKSLGQVRLLRSARRSDGTFVLYLSQPVDLSRAVSRVGGRETRVVYGETLREVILPVSSSSGSGPIEVRISGMETLDGPVGEWQTSIERPSAEDRSGLIISEIMIDPPTVGPLARIPYVEIANRGTAPVDLGRVILRCRTTAYDLPPLMLSPGGYAVLHSSQHKLPQESIHSLPMDHFPSMSGSFALSLEGRDGQSIDRVVVDDRLREPGLQREGRSIERIESDPPQWRYSTAPMGGTPGAPSLMRPYETLAAGALVVNELMLSPESVGEKYIELYNTSTHPIELEGVYMSFRNSPDGSYSAWPLVVSPYTLPAKSYAVLTPYPPALERLYPLCDPSTLVERIDFPSISPTYSEISLIARADRTTIDQVVYRRQWLGDTAADRTRHSLERVSPQADGTKKSAWRRASEASRGGTPGRLNSSSTENGSEGTWPDDPHLSYEQMMALLPLYGELATLELFTLEGQQIYRKEGREVRPFIEKLQDGKAPLPTLIVVVRVTFTSPDPDLLPLTYSGKWVHAGAM